MIKIQNLNVDQTRGAPNLCERLQEGIQEGDQVLTTNPETAQAFSRTAQGLIAILALSFNGWQKNEAARLLKQEEIFTFKGVEAVGYVAGGSHTGLYMRLIGEPYWTHVGIGSMKVPSIEDIMTAKKGLENYAVQTGPIEYKYEHQRS